GPILANLIIITRSSSPMAMELATMKSKGVINTMAKDGNDPFTVLVLPRVLGFALSTFGITLIFILVALASGYAFGAWLGTGSRNLWYFTETVLTALHPEDMLSITAKSILPALFSGATCCIAGLDVSDLSSDAARVTQRALTRSVAGLFVISALVSALTYL
ncbi:MAG TPA: ABC transporter permease, partial [Methylomirabilota bacterium]|nr:ABC transporter permease [Methylomirabilota bacterium]